MKKIVLLLFVCAAPAIMWGQYESVEINETNFGDKSFCDFLKAKYDTNQDEKLTPSEVKNHMYSYSYKDYGYMVCVDSGIKGEIKLSFFYLNGGLNGGSMKWFHAYNLTGDPDDPNSNPDTTNDITSIDFTPESNDSQYATLEWFHVQLNRKLTTIKGLGTQTNLKGFEAGATKLTKETLSTINATNHPNLQQVLLQSCGLTDESFNVNNLSNKLQTLRCSGNNLTMLNLSGKSNLEFLECSFNRLSALDVSSSTNLKILYCPINCITELDLSKNKKLESSTTWEAVNHYSTTRSTNISPQNVSLPVCALADRSRIGVKCQTDNGTLSSYTSITTDEEHPYTIVGACNVGTDENKINYILLNDGTTGDKNWHNKVATYNYITGYTGSVEVAKKMLVNVTTDAYVMYLNPRAKGTDTKRYDDSEFYYGTLCLDYPARIPDGAKVYYASSFDLEKEELIMEEIPADKVIPAGTPIYVEGTDGSGYYPFHDATMYKDGVAGIYEVADEEYVSIEENYLTGTLTEITNIPSRSVLTLGHDKSTNKMGFWNFTGSTIPAHRAYVSAETLAGAGQSNPNPAKGLILHFSNDDDDATGISTISTEQNGERADWYTLQGVRLHGKPTASGIYMKGGKKVFIK